MMREKSLQGLALLHHLLLHLQSTKISTSSLGTFMLMEGWQNLRGITDVPVLFKTIYHHVLLYFTINIDLFIYDEVTGFSVGGRVVEGNDAGVDGVKIFVDGQWRATTDTQGLYKLDQNYVGANSHLQMYGSASEKSPQSKGQSSNTDTVHGKSVKYKSTTPSSINGMIEQKCEVLDWRQNLIATGRVCRDHNQSSCHKIPINKEVVIIDIIHNGEAELYAPSSFADILSDVGISDSMKWHVSVIIYV